MFKYFKKWWAVLIIFALSFWAVKPLSNPGFFPIHDDEQIARIVVLDSALRDGQFPVRWVDNLGFGFGYPLFNFYPPLSYYSAEILHLLGFSFIDSAKIIIFLGFLLSGFLMYLWVKDHFGKLPAVFSAILFIYAPYHSVNVYVRGSLPDFLSYAFFPAVFLLLDRLFKTGKIRYSILLGVLLAVLPLTHILNIISFPIFILIYLIYLFITNKKNKDKILHLFISLLIAFGLTAFFLIPAILEKGYTLVDKVNVGELYNYKLHFVYLRQFLNSPWGYGGSIYGLEDGISFEVGKPHLLFAFLAFVVLSLSLIKKEISKFKIAIVSLFLFLLSLYLSSFYSDWLWSKVNVLTYLQFPWRFLSFTAVFSSFAGGFVILYIKKQFGEKYAVSLVILGLILLWFTSVPNFKPQKYLTVGDEYYENSKDISWRVSKASFEFVPRDVKTKLSDIGTTQVDLEEKDIPTSSYKIIKGNAKVEVFSNKSQFKQFKVNASSDTVFQLNTFSFPGWKTQIDGKDVKYQDDNKLRLIVLDIPRGSHMVTAEFRNTVPRAVGNAITLVTIFNILGFVLLRYKDALNVR